MQSLQGEVLALLVVAESSYTELQHHSILPHETRLLLQWRDNSDLWQSSMRQWLQGAVPMRHNGSNKST